MCWNFGMSIFEVIILIGLVVFGLLTLLYSGRERKEEKRKRIKAERKMREEEENKRIEAERRMREEEENKRIEAELRMREEEEKKRIEAERRMEEEEERKRKEEHQREEFQMPQVQGNDGEKGLSKALACTGSGASGEDSRTQASVVPKDQLTDTSSGGGVSSKRGDQQAIPLCLPNNCTWNSETGQCIETEEERRSLYVVEEALEQLRKIKEPVCVVSIAGQYRKGKSFVLSEVFSQPEVFPLGHQLTPATMGIWLWIVPGKFEDPAGKKFKVVLLDSEGIDSVICKGYDDSQILTLTVLLASVLIYNSQGVPTRTDLEGLNFIVKLSQSIEVQSKTNAGAGKSLEDSTLFFETFPFFIWLLRDVTQDLPPDCKDIKEYFLKKVFKVPDSSLAGNQDHQKVADSILGYFSGFEAFSLPPPTVDKELMKNIKDNKSQMSPFFQELDQFRQKLENILSPKKSFNKGELVTGEGLAALVQSYVEAINSPGTIPNIQNAWETFVEKKCSEAITEAVKKYEEVMKSNLEEERPCDSDELRKFHGTALDKGKGYFMTETVGISTNSTEKHLNKLKELLKGKLISWETRNEKLTRESCNSLVTQLKEKHLDPVLQRLQGKEAAKISFKEIIGGYNQMQEDYQKSAIGAKDVIAAVFAEFHPALLRERDRSLNLLEQLKDYDEKLAKELAAKARQEQEMQKLEEERKKVLQMNQEMKEEMEMLCRKQNEDWQKFQEQMEKDHRLQLEQMKNMMDANMKSAKHDRELFVKNNKDLQNKCLAFQKENEERMKEIGKMHDLLAKNNEERRQLSEQMQLTAKAASDREEEMKERHTIDRQELSCQLEDLKAYMEKTEKTLREVTAAAAIREQQMEEIEEKAKRDLESLTSHYEALDAKRRQDFEEVQEKLNSVEKKLVQATKPGIFGQYYLGTSRWVEEKCFTM